MTETYAGQTAVEDIVEDDDVVSAELERQADAILLEAEEQASGPRPLRQAVREDATTARDWGRQRAVRLRGVVEAEPVKATLYALGIGVVIGLLAAR
jgi:hypothetical protein